MESCRCSEYRKAVENCKIFNIATLHYLTERLKAPEGFSLKWTTKMTKPIFVKSVEKEKAQKEDYNRWLPVCSDLISLRLVNEQKKLHSPF